MELKKLRNKNIDDVKKKLNNPPEEIKLSKLLQAYNELEKSISSLKEKGIKEASLKSLKKDKKDYRENIAKLVKQIAPKTAEIATPLLAAKLIVMAGNLKKLAGMASSKIQVLGAEKAFFKHLKTGSKSPKHGIIFFHPSVLESENRGKAARQLSNEIAKSARLDYYSK